MKRLGIKAKIWLSVAIFGAGYVILLILLQWTTSQVQSHMKVASKSLFPAALSSQEADAAFQKVGKRYSDAVLLQDKKGLAEAEWYQCPVPRETKARQTCSRRSRRAEN